MTVGWYDGQRPLTLAIVALGGEGGGVLADWVVTMAEQAGYWAQTTSVPGVAQRTGATIYYVEILPPGQGPVALAGGRSEPVLSIFPTPGEVDVVIASELMECGRAIQRGFVTPDRTTLITSTSRTYTIDEKMVLGDGRVDSTELLTAAQRSAKRLIAADFMEIAERCRSVISASLFGALAASGTLPFSSEQFETAIRAFGKAVESSLQAFSAGYEAAMPAPIGARKPPATRKPIPISIGPRPVTVEERKAEEEARRTAVAATDPAALVGRALRVLAGRVTDLPPAARSMILHGLVRTAVYQNLAYAERYLERVTRFARIDPDPQGAARLTTEAARHITLWMCYQDTIHVALQKTRQARMERIRKEAKAKPNQLMQVREYLHPQIDELTDTMPERLGARMRRSKLFQRLVHALTHKGMIVNTSSLTGYTVLSTLARLRPLRPRSLRFVREQAAIEAWLEQALNLGAEDPELGCEIVKCEGVLKGYGATYAHGSDSFEKLMTAARALAGTPGAAARLEDLRLAALADEDGAALAAKIAESVRP